MRLKPDFERAQQRLMAFWAHEMLDRACIAVIAPKTPGVNTSFFLNDIDFHGDSQALKAYWTDAETIRRVNLGKLEQTHLGGEALPILFQNYGTSGHCNYYGAAPSYGQDTIWFEPVLHSLEPQNLVYRPDVLERHLDIARYLVAHAGDDYLVGMPDSTGTLDALGHLYGTQNLLLDMLEDPDIVAQAVRTVNEGWIDSNERFYQTARENNANGCSHAWMHLWAPGRIQHMQCDLSVMISPDMYETLVLPELEQQLRWLEYPVYHFDGIEQEKHLPYLLSLEKLRAIQWTHVAGQPSAIHYLPVLQRIQAAGKGLIIMTPAGDVPALLDNLSAAGLYLHCSVHTPEEADALVRYVHAHSVVRR